MTYFGKTYIYPAIDSDTVVAWNFTGSAGNIINLGSAGSGADMTVIGSAVRRNIPGPVEAGVGFYGQSSGGTPPNNGIYSTMGAANGSDGIFTTEMTLLAFFDLNLDPSVTGGNRTIIYKSYSNTWSGAPYTGAALIWVAGALIGGVTVAGGVDRSVNSSLNNLSYGFRPGFHMAAYTYGTEGGSAVGRLYWDGIEHASTNFGTVQNLLLWNGSNTGTWGVGNTFVNTQEGMNGVMYHARAEKIARSAEWIRQAWCDFNGWQNRK